MQTDSSIYAALVGVILTGGVAVFYLWNRYRFFDTSETLRKLFPVMLAIFAGTVTLTFSLFIRPQVAEPAALPSVTAEERVKDLENQLKRLSGTLDAIEKQLAQPSSNTTGGVEPISPAALASIDQRLIQNSESIRKFEELLVTDAARLVTLPLLQRDFQAIKEDVVSVKDNVNGLRSLLSETGSQNRWVIGTLALGMLGLVIPAVKSLFTPSANSADNKPGTGPHL